MKKILFVSAFTCFSLAMNAQSDVAKTVVVPTEASATADEILGLKETEYNFGKIPQGKPVTHEFKVTNNSKTPLKIDNVQASCGCTTPTWDRENAIAPGQEGIITVGYNAAAEGPFTKPITITYNGTQTKQLMIKGEVWKTPAESAPANAGVNELKN